MVECCCRPSSQTSPWKQKSGGNLQVPADSEAKIKITYFYKQQPVDIYVNTEAFFSLLFFLSDLREVMSDNLMTSDINLGTDYFVSSKPTQGNKRKIKEIVIPFHAAVLTGAESLFSCFSGKKRKKLLKVWCLNTFVTNLCSGIVNCFLPQSLCSSDLEHSHTASAGAHYKETKIYSPLDNLVTAPKTNQDTMIIPKTSHYLPLVMVVSICRKRTMC